jgi:hypothetical protein
MNKSLLLDIDGVIVRDKALLSHVKDNCVRYVQSKFPDSKNPEEINKMLYLAHGHTAVGLRHVYKMENDGYDFNSKVYDKNLLDHLSEVIHGTEFQREAKEIHSLISNGMNVTLFTNSPIEWARPVARAISDEICISCTNTSAEFLKPGAAAYASFPTNYDYLYVDDTLKNLGAIRNMKNWQPLYFGNDEVDWCPTVRTIHEVCQIARLFQIDTRYNQGRGKGVRYSSQ